MPVPGSNRPLLLLTLLVFVGLFSLSRNHKDAVPGHASSSKPAKLAPTPALVNQAGERASAVTSGGARNDASSKTIQQRIIAVGAHPLHPCPRDLIVLKLRRNLARRRRARRPARLDADPPARSTRRLARTLDRRARHPRPNWRYGSHESVFADNVAGSADAHVRHAESGRYRRPRTRHDRDLPLLPDLEAAGRSRWWRSRFFTRQSRAHELSRWQVGSPPCHSRHKIELILGLEPPPPHRLALCDERRHCFFRW